MKSPKHPTSVRLDPEDRDWVGEQAKRHPHGRTGVITEAIRHYRTHLEQQETLIFDAVVNSGRPLDD